MYNPPSAKSLCGIVIYLGHLGDLQRYSIYSIAKSFDRTFVVTDDPTYAGGDGIQKIEADAATISRRIRDRLSVENPLSNPYKLCDFHPFWPLLFSEFIQEYTDVAVFDVDCLWGDIQSFLPSTTTGDLPVVIGDRGHYMQFPTGFAFTMPSCFDKYFGPATWRDALRSAKNVALDEFHWTHRMLDAIENARGVRWDNRISRKAADINYWRPDFCCVNRKLRIRYVSVDFSTPIPEVCISAVTRHGVQEIEVPYVHLQKRKIVASNLAYRHLYFSPGRNGTVMVSLLPNPGQACSATDRIRWGMSMFYRRFKAKLFYESL
jgi:hypothetical protein